MPKRAISVTLAVDNVVWLKARSGAVGESVSAALDRLVTVARQARSAGPARSVVGSIDIDAADPLLDQANVAVRAAFDASIGRPFMLRERGRAFGAPRKRDV